MVKLNLGDKSYEFPKRLTVEQWQSVAQLDLEEPLTWPKALHLVTGAPLEILRKADDQALQLGMGFLLALLKDRVEVEEYKPFGELKFGEWVDLDIWSVWGPRENLKDFLSLLAPQITYADEGLWLWDKYQKWRISMYRSYRALFGIDDPTGDEEESQRDKMQIARSWYALIIRLAGDDILKVDQVTEEPLIKTLNFLAYQKEKDLKEWARQIENKRKNDLQRNSRSSR